jgi:hypothetical protein
MPMTRSITSQGRGCTRPAVEQERNLAAYQNRQLSDLWYSTTHPHFQQKLRHGIPAVVESLRVYSVLHRSSWASSEVRPPQTVFSASKVSKDVMHQKS